MSADRTVPCPVCLGRDIRAWKFELLRCTACGAGLNPHYGDPLAATAAQTRFFDGASAARGDNRWVRLFEEWNNRRTVRRIASRIARPGSLLEVGVGSGSFLAAMRHRGWTVHGCDLSKVVIGRVSARYGIAVEHGSIADLPSSPAYDLIVMNHVLEHVDNPLSLLAEACRRLKPGGLLHLAVPNVSCLEASLPGWNSYEPYHIVYYSPASLHRALQAAGLSPVWMGTHESFSGWALAALRTGLRRGVTQSTSGAVAHPAPRSSTVEAMYRLAVVAAGLLTLPARKLQAWANRGDELIALAMPVRAQHG